MANQIHPFLFHRMFVLKVFSSWVLLLICIDDILTSPLSIPASIVGIGARFSSNVFNVGKSVKSAWNGIQPITRTFGRRVDNLGLRPSGRALASTVGSKAVKPFGESASFAIVPKSSGVQAVSKGTTQVLEKGLVAAGASRASLFSKAITTLKPPSTIKRLEAARFLREVTQGRSIPVNRPLRIQERPFNIESLSGKAAPVA
jgi:hypothetical protein